MSPTEALDRYLLRGEGGKPELVAELLAHRSAGAAAAPFYRALEILGGQVPDDALIALRLALSGRQPGDDEVLALRDIVRESRSAPHGGPAEVHLLDRYREIVKE